jgi:hypothetical protein
MLPKYAPITGTGGVSIDGGSRDFNVVAGYVFDLQPQDQEFCNSLPADIRDDFTRFCASHKLSILGNNTDICTSWKVPMPTNYR